MIYKSFANSPGNVDGMDLNNWVLRRKGKDGGPVWQGGSPKAAEAKISEGDVARVCSVLFLISTSNFSHLRALINFTGRTTVSQSRRVEQRCDGTWQVGHWQRQEAQGEGQRCGSDCRAS